MMAECVDTQCKEELLSLYAENSEFQFGKEPIPKKNALCDQSELENGEQQVPSDTLMAFGISTTNSLSTEPNTKSSDCEDHYVDDSCVGCSDREPMLEKYGKSLYALRPHFEKVLLVDNFISKLHVDAGGFLSDNEEEDIELKPTRQKKVRLLLKILKTKTNRDFHTFCEVLQSSGLEHFANQLRDEAGVKRQLPKDENPAETDKKLQEKTFAFGLGTLEEAVKNLGPLRGQVLTEFRNSVMPLRCDSPTYNKVRSMCQALISSKAGVSTFESIPLEVRAFADHIIEEHTTALDIELIHEVANILDEPTLIRVVAEYEAQIKPYMQLSIDQLTDRCEEKRIDEDSPPGTYKLVLRFPDNANVKALYNAKHFLEKYLHISEAKFLAFDYGCILVYFEIICTDDVFKHLPKRLTDHSDRMKPMGINGVFLISYWAWNSNSNDIYYHDDNDESLIMEVGIKHDTNFKIPEGLQEPMSCVCADKSPVLNLSEYKTPATPVCNIVTITEFGESTFEIMFPVGNKQPNIESGGIIDAQCVLQKKLPDFPVPPHKFLEDRAELKDIKEKFEQLRHDHEEEGVVSVYVTGPPASGKTQICRMYARRWFECRLKQSPEGLYLPVLLLEACSKEGLYHSLCQCLEVIRTQEYIEKINAEVTDRTLRLNRYLEVLCSGLKEKVYAKYGEDDEWLLVIDGAFNNHRDTPLRIILNNLKDCGYGRVLIAMQERCSQPGKHPHEEVCLGSGFSPNDSLHFLQMYFPDEDVKKLEEVGEKLSHIPFSLAAMCEVLTPIHDNKHYLTWDSFLNHGEGIETAERLLCEKPNSYGKTLPQALNLAVDRMLLQQTNLERPVKETFFLLGVCGNGNLPKTLLKTYITHNDECEDAVYLQLQEELEHDILLSDQGDCISVHTIMHSVLRKRVQEAMEEMSQLKKAEEVNRVVNALCCTIGDAMLDNPGTDMKTIQTKLQLVPHFQSVNKFLQKYPDIAHENRIMFSICWADLQKLIGQFGSARETLTESMQLLGCIKADEYTKTTFRSVMGHEMVEAHMMDEAIVVLTENVLWRRKQIGVIEDRVSKKKIIGKHVSGSIDRKGRKEFVNLCEDLIHLGYAYKARGEAGDIFQADRVTEECLLLLSKWHEKIPSHLNECWTKCLYLRAQVYKDQACHQEAADVLKKLLEGIACLNPSHFKAELKRSLTDMLLEPNAPLRDLATAKREIEQAVLICREIYPGEPHPLTAYCLMTCGRFWKECGDFDKALKKLDEAQKTSNEVPEVLRYTKLTPLVLYFKGECYLGKGEFQRACNFFEKSRELTKEKFGARHPQNSYILDRLGNIYTVLNRPEEAIQCLKESVDIKIENFGAGNKMLQETYAMLETACYECVNPRDNEALEFRSKRMKMYDSPQASSDEMDWEI